MTTPSTPQDEVIELQRQLALSKQEVERLERELNDDKAKQMGVEFYSAGLSAWYNSALELDKSIFTFASGGVGLLVGILMPGTTLPVFIFCVAATLCFLSSIGMVLVVFQLNKTYLVRLFQNESPDDSLLSVLDKGAAIMFSMGVVLTIVVGIMTAVAKMNVS